jgi:hypothetical protein
MTPLEQKQTGDLFYTATEQDYKFTMFVLIGIEAVSKAIKNVFARRDDEAIY